MQITITNCFFQVIPGWLDLNSYCHIPFKRMTSLFICLFYNNIPGKAFSCNPDKYHE